MLITKLDNIELLVENGLQSLHLQTEGGRHAYLAMDTFAAQGGMVFQETVGIWVREQIEKGGGIEPWDP